MTEETARDELEFVLGDNAAATLRSYADTIIKTKQEIADLQEHVKAARAEAKANGFDVKALETVVRALIAEQEGKSDDRVQFEGVQRTYLRAVGLEVAD